MRTTRLAAPDVDREVVATGDLEKRIMDDRPGWSTVDFLLAFRRMMNPAEALNIAKAAQDTLPVTTNLFWVQRFAMH
jgi:hypothetical protein